VFYYDRLGVGHSSRASGYENQFAPQLELLTSIIKAVRQNKYTDDIKAAKVALIGHSYGSWLSNAVLAKTPELVDAAALTGISYPNATDPAAQTISWVLEIFAARIANMLPAASRPQFAETLDTGYLSFGDIFGYIQGFLHQPNYEVAAAEYSFKVSQALAISELLTGTTSVSPEYKGKVLVTSGQFDALLCNGDCVSTYAYGTQSAVFPNTKVKTYLQPGSGHGQNFEKNAPELYAEIMKILA
jgi:pimeloyl-ACP methyl ester carboxylesterase